MESYASWVKANSKHWVRSYYDGDVYHVEVLKKRCWLLFWLSKWKVIKHTINGVEQ